MARRERIKLDDLRRDNERELIEQRRAAEVQAKQVEREAAAARRQEQERRGEQGRLEAEQRSAEVAEQMREIDHWLASRLGRRPTAPTDLVRPLMADPFDAGFLADAEPPPAPPRRPGGLARLLPHRQRQHENALSEYRLALDAHARREAARLEQLHATQIAFERAAARKLSERAYGDRAVQDHYEGYRRGDPTSIGQWMRDCVLASAFPVDEAADVIVDFDPQSRQLVLDIALPRLDSIPEASSFRFVKSADAIVATPRTAASRRHTYTSLIAQIALCTIQGCFIDDIDGHIDCIALNGFVDTIDLATGHSVRPCLVTVRVTRDRFGTLQLSNVDPIVCLQSLHAAVSKSPSELVPVRPIVALDMRDRRFVEEQDVLSGLEQRPNLMELTPSEFESLITNLFSAMGLETRLTQASRDGGVDCVAFDMRPVLGGKVVIQAKRYADTVGVSAVRDLYGTVLNEGASKGILVTTSGYGQAAFDFAANKPLELLSGANLLSLLIDYAGIDARIDVPEETATA